MRRECSEEVEQRLGYVIYKKLGYQKKPRDAIILSTAAHMYELASYLNGFEIG